jgi:hypothetical protein
MNTVITINTIRDLVDTNQHSSATLVLAQLTDLPALMKKAQDICSRHTILGHSTEAMINERNKIDKACLAYLNVVWTKADMEELYKAL